MPKSKLVKVSHSIEKVVVDRYQQIENFFVNGYNQIENFFVTRFEKLTDRFIEHFLIQDHETMEEARKRLQQK